MPTLDADARRLHDARRLRRAAGRRRRTTSRASATEHADIPATYVDRLVRRASRTPTPSTSRRWRRRTTTPQRLIVGPWSHVGMRGDATYTLDVDFGPDVGLGRAALLRGAARVLRPLAAARTATRRPDEAPVRIFVMGGGRGRKTALGKLDHGGRWRDEHEWPLARAQQTPSLPARRRLALARGAARARRAAALHLRPRRTRCRRSAATTARSASSRPRAPGMEPTWSRLLNPALRLRNIMTPGPADQKESRGVLHRAGAVPAAVRARRRARLPDRAARASRSR